MSEYKWSETPEGYDETYDVLVGPDGFECVLGEPEDRMWSRDGKEAVDRLNEQHAEIARLRAELEKANAALGDAINRLGEQARARGVAEGRVDAAQAREAGLVAALDEIDCLGDSCHASRLQEVAHQALSGGVRVVARGGLVLREVYRRAHGLCWVADPVTICGSGSEESSSPTRRKGATMPEINVRVLAMMMSHIPPPNGIDLETWAGWLDRAFPDPPDAGEASDERLIKHIPVKVIYQVLHSLVMRLGADPNVRVDLSDLRKKLEDIAPKPAPRLKDDE